MVVHRKPPKWNLIGFDNHSQTDPVTQGPSGSLNRLAMDLLATDPQRGSEPSFQASRSHRRKAVADGPGLTNQQETIPGTCLAYPKT